MGVEVRPRRWQAIEDEDTLGRWIAEACDQRPSGTELVSTLFNAWKIWAEAAGEHAGSIRGFSQNLASRGFAKWRDPGTTQRGYRGIALLTDLTGGFVSSVHAYARV
jgi:putative DNA primase/helicase